MVPFRKSFLIFEQNSNNICSEFYLHSIYITETLMPFPLKVLVAFIKIIIFTIVPFCKSFLILEQYSNNICPHSIYITETLMPFPLKVPVAYS